MNKSQRIKEICKADNQKQLNQEFNESMYNLHNEYSELINESEYLNKLMKKYKKE